MGRSATCEVSGACAKMPSSSPRTICLILMMRAKVAYFARRTEFKQNASLRPSTVERAWVLWIVKP